MTAFADRTVVTIAVSPSVGSLVDFQNEATNQEIYLSQTIDTLQLAEGFGLFWADRCRYVALLWASCASIIFSLRVLYASFSAPFPSTLTVFLYCTFSLWYCLVLCFLFLPPLDHFYLSRPPSLFFHLIFHLLIFSISSLISPFPFISFHSPFPPILTPSHPLMSPLSMMFSVPPLSLCPATSTACPLSWTPSRCWSSPQGSWWKVTRVPTC